MLVSAIVCTRNRAARYLPRSLASLAAQASPPDEILVIDNASGDDTAMTRWSIPSSTAVSPSEDRGPDDRRRGARP